MRNKSFAKFLPLLVSALLSTGSAAARADTFNLGPLPTFPLPFNTLVTHAPGRFVDFFYFEVIPQQHLVSNTAVSLNLRFSSGLDYQIDGLNVEFYDISNSFYGIAYGAGSPQEAVLEQALSPGYYYSAVSGLTSGTAGGTYAYSISAVPEANTGLLMLLGLAAVSLLAFRRQRV